MLKEISYLNYNYTKKLNFGKNPFSKKTNKHY